MITVRMISTGEVKEVTRNVAFGLVDSKQATLVKGNATPRVIQNDSTTEGVDTYHTRQMNAGFSSASINPNAKKQKGYKVKSI